MGHRSVYWSSDQVTRSTDAERKARADADAFTKDAEVCPQSCNPSIRWAYAYTDHYRQLGRWEVLIDN